MSKPRVLVATPTRGNPCYELTQWFVKMKDKASKPDCPFELKMLIGKAGHQNPTNNALLNAAFMDTEFQWDYYLKIDDDLVPDEDLIERLLKLDKDVVGVGIAIWRESLNGVFIAASNFDGKSYIRVPLETERQGPCYYVGGGCMMVKRHVLESMRDNVWKYESNYIYGTENQVLNNLPPQVTLKRVPVWCFEYNNNGLVGLGSDELFCKKAREMGFEIWYDCTVVLEQHTDLLVGASRNGGVVSVDIHQNQNDKGKKRMVNKEDLEKGTFISTRWESPLEEGETPPA